MGINIAAAIDAIPIVLNTLDRAAKFPTPTLNQRVENLQTGNVERWNGSAWVIDYLGSVNNLMPGTSLTVYAGNFTSGTTEQNISAAIALAVSVGAAYVFVPGAMLPYNASLVTFSTGVRMIREGGDSSAWEVLAYGADGTGTADATAASQAAASGAGLNGGKMVYAPGKSFKLSGFITLGSFTEVVATGATITQVTANTASIGGGGLSRITMRGGFWVGPGQATFTDPDKGTIYFFATGGVGCDDVRLYDVEASQTGGGISNVFGGRCWIHGCYVHDYGGTTGGPFGILVSCTQFFSVRGNRIYNCTTVANPCYGITATGNSFGGLPQDQCIVAENLIDGVPAWTGFMTHECTDLLIANNTFKNVRNGIQVGLFTVNNVMQRVTIANNNIVATTVDAWSTAAATHSGIQVTGYSGTVRGTTVSIIGGTISGFFNLAGSPTFAGESACVAVDDFDDVTISGVTISGVGAQGNASVGIQIAGTVNQLTISACTLDGAFGIPVDFVNSTVDVASIGSLTINDTNAVSPSVLINGAQAIAVLVMNGVHTTAPTTFQDSTLSVAEFRSGDLKRTIALVSGVAPAINAMQADIFTLAILTNIVVVVPVPSRNPNSQNSGNSAGQTKRIATVIRNASGGALTTQPSFSAGAGGFRYASGALPASLPNGEQYVALWDWDPVQAYFYLSSVAGPA